MNLASIDFDPIFGKKYYFYRDFDLENLFLKLIFEPKYTLFKRKMTMNSFLSQKYTVFHLKIIILFILLIKNGLIWIFLDIFRPYGDVVSARVYRPYSTLPNEITRWCPSVEVQDSFSAVVEYPTARCAKFAVGVLRERVQANRYRYLCENSPENSLEKPLENSPGFSFLDFIFRPRISLNWVVLNQKFWFKTPHFKTS